ncbi:MAG TPA: CBS domain-containing protein [Candidatus Limnocylindria bacterium]|jgi:CBS domain-containing protein
MTSSPLTPRTTVADLMSPDPVVVRDDAPLARAARLLDEHRVHGLPVVDETGALVGVVSQTDMLRARTTEHLWSSWRGLQVRHLMSAPALTVKATSSLTEAAGRMEENHVHRLVVVGPDGATPVGIVSTSDLIRAMSAELTDE